MEMTTREIVIDYKNAVIKGKQITILAQLNNCTTDKIRAELIRGGIPKRELYKVLGKRHIHEQAKIKAIVSRIIQDGTKNSTEGNWITPFSKFKTSERFVREHQAEIAVELESRKVVSDVVLDVDGFDVNYYTDFIKNKKQEELS